MEKDGFSRSRGVDGCKWGVIKDSVTMKEAHHTVFLLEREVYDKRVLKIQEKKLDEEDSSSRWLTKTDQKQGSCGGVRGIVDVRGSRGDVARDKRDLLAGSFWCVAVSTERRHNQVLIINCERNSNSASMVQMTALQVNSIPVY